MSAKPSVPMVSLSLKQVEDLTFRALIACGVSPANALSVTASVVAAEAEGVHSHGLARLPTYCAHAKVKKIDGRATPDLTRPRPGLLRVDAQDGFAADAAARSEINPDGQNRGKTGRPRASENCS